MKVKSIKFECKGCKTPVYRLGKSVSLELGLCGRCNGQVPQSVKVAQDVVGIASDTTSSDVKAALVSYRNHLDRVEKLAISHPTATFLELWHATK